MNSKHATDLRIRKRKTNDDVNESTESVVTDKRTTSKSTTEDPIGSTSHGIWTRTVMIISVMTIVYFYTKNQTDVKFAIMRENITLRLQKIPCSPKYLAEIDNFPKCVPPTCGRFVSDVLIGREDSEILFDFANRVIKLGGSSGGASILDLHSGALSIGERFINVYTLPEAKDAFKNDVLVAYKSVKSKVKLAVAEQFGISVDNLYLTHPTFFSRITNETAKTMHDEYWHPHVDKETYESFHYTSLLYLNNFNKDFKGGRFLFIDGKEKDLKLSSIEPKQGRISAFTSGAENLHNVEKVTEGTRFAITISFTCNPKFAIEDPKLDMN